jgi:hypothetical protein
MLLTNSVYLYGKTWSNIPEEFYQYLFSMALYERKIISGEKL